MTETRAAARVRIGRNGLFIGARTPCSTVRRSYANEFGAKKAPEPMVRRSVEIVATGTGSTVVCRFRELVCIRSVPHEAVDLTGSSPATATDSTLEYTSITSCTDVKFRCYAHAKSYGACRASATVRRVRLDSRAISSACTQHIAQSSTSRSEASNARDLACDAIASASMRAFSTVERDRALRASNARASSRTSDRDRACVPERCRCDPRASAADDARAARRSGIEGDGTALR